MDSEAARTSTSAASQSSRRSECFRPRRRRGVAGARGDVVGGCVAGASLGGSEPELLFEQRSTASPLLSFPPPVIGPSPPESEHRSITSSESELSSITPPPSAPPAIEPRAARAGAAEPSVAGVGGLWPVVRVGVELMRAVVRVVVVQQQISARPRSARPQRSERCDKPHESAAHTPRTEMGSGVRLHAHAKSEPQRRSATSQTWSPVARHLRRSCPRAPPRASEAAQSDCRTSRPPSSPSTASTEPRNADAAMRAGENLTPHAPRPARSRYRAIISFERDRVKTLRGGPAASVLGPGHLGITQIAYILLYRRYRRQAQSRTACRASPP